MTFADPQFRANLGGLQFFPSTSRVDTVTVAFDQALDGDGRIVLQPWNGIAPATIVRAFVVVSGGDSALNGQNWSDFSLPDLGGPSYSGRLWIQNLPASEANYTGYAIIEAVVGAYAVQA